MAVTRKPPTGWGGGYYSDLPNLGMAPSLELGELLLAPLIEDAKRERDKFNVDGTED